MVLVQKFKKKRKWELRCFKVTVKSLPNVPIFCNMESSCVNRSCGKVNLKIPVTEDMNVVAMYREKGWIETIVPAPSLTMGEYIEGSYDFIILKTEYGEIIRHR